MHSATFFSVKAQQSASSAFPTIPGNLLDASYVYLQLTRVGRHVGTVRVGGRWIVEWECLACRHDEKRGAGVGGAIGNLF